MPVMEFPADQEQTLDVASTLPILEPLCKATEQTLAPVPLFQNDYLEIDLDEEGKRFITQATALRPAESFDAPESVIEFADGRRMVKTTAPSAVAAYGWQKRIPERKEVGYGRWIFATTDFTALVIHHVWLADHLIFKSEGAQVTYTFLLKRFLVQAKAARIVADFKINETDLAMPADFVEHREMPMTKYQKAAMIASMNQDGYALFMEQGTGKTAIVINRICLEGSRKFRGELAGTKRGMYRALIICPKQVRMNWENEFVRFSTVPGKTVVLRGGQVDRVKCLIEGVRVDPECAWSACIVSTDSVDSTFESLGKVPWDLVVIDECHYIKRYSTKRFRSIKKFATMQTVRARMGLTGTPIPNSIFDLWSQLEFLGEGLSGFSTYPGFKSFHGQFKKSATAGGTSIQKLTGIKAVPLLQERLSRLAFMLRKSEAGLGLPDKVYDIVEVEMTPKQNEYYQTLSAKLVLEIEEMLDQPAKEMRVDHILTKLLRLAQITSGFVKWNADIDPLTGEERSSSNVEQIPGGNPKVDAIVEMLQDPDRDPNGKTIIWAHFVEDIRVVSAKLHELGIKHVGYHANILDEYRAANSETAVDRFNKDRDCRVLLANPASGGTGLNIIGYDQENPEAYETYCDHEIFMSCDWNAAKRSQAEDRAHRRGTRMPVKITDLVIPGTIDEEIRARVMAKLQTSLLIQDIRDILKRLVGRK